MMPALTGGFFVGLKHETPNPKCHSHADWLAFAFTMASFFIPFFRPLVRGRTAVGIADANGSVRSKGWGIEWVACDRDDGTKS